jgi:hypothetical protein
VADVRSGPEPAARVWRLLPERAILAAIGGAVVLALVAISPPVADRVEDGAVFHFTQHGVLFVAAMLMGAGLRDLVSARPMRPLVAVGLGFAALVGDIATLLPPFDDAIEESAALHDTQHGLVFLAGAVMGLALRDLVLRGRGPRRPA